MIRIPTVLWQEKLALTLGPNETRMITLTANTNLPANSAITVSLSETNSTGKMPGIEPGIVALIISTAITNRAADDIGIYAH